MNDEHSSEHSDIILRDDGYPEYRPAPQPLPFYVATELAQLRAENEQLRALVDDCENRMYHDSFRIDYDGGDEMEKKDAELRAIQQRAKALGIKVNE